MPSITTSDKINLFYSDNNPTGPNAIVFLHGLGATSESWLLQETYFMEKGFRVVIPDMRGFGKSGFGGNSLPINRLAADIAELMDQLHIDKATVVGISMGGVVALALALARPEKISKLVLTNTFAALRPGSIGSW